MPSIAVSAVAPQTTPLVVCFLICQPSTILDCRTRLKRTAIQSVCDSERINLLDLRHPRGEGRSRTSERTWRGRACLLSQKSKSTDEAAPGI